MGTQEFHGLFFRLHLEMLNDISFIKIRSKIARENGFKVDSHFFWQNLNHFVLFYLGKKMSTFNFHTFNNKKNFLKRICISGNIRNIFHSIWTMTLQDIEQHAAVIISYIIAYMNGFSGRKIHFLLSAKNVSLNNFSCPTAWDKKKYCRLYRARIDI